MILSLSPSRKQHLALMQRLCEASPLLAPHFPLLAEPQQFIPSSSCFSLPLCTSHSCPCCSTWSTENPPGALSQDVEQVLRTLHGITAQLMQNPSCRTSLWPSKAPASLPSFVCLAQTTVGLPPSKTSRLFRVSSSPVCHLSVPEVEHLEHLHTSGAEQLQAQPQQCPQPCWVSSSHGQGASWGWLRPRGLCIPPEQRRLGEEIPTAPSEECSPLG